MVGDRTRRSLMAEGGVGKEGVREIEVSCVVLD